MREKLYTYAMNSQFFIKLLKYSCILLPNINILKKYKNIINNIIDIKVNNTILKSNPISVRIAPIAVCNYGCLFCEIHKDNLLYPSRSKNVINLDHIKKYESFLSTTYTLSFYGGSEEPFLNPHIVEIVKYLKAKYNLRLVANTNASTMNKKMSDIFVKYGFDDILISYHAATKKGYLELMTGDIDKINTNIEYLQKLKQQKKKKLPVLKYNFALQKNNANEAIPIIESAKKYNINSILVSKYYGGRNMLQDKHVSYEYDIDEGNQVLDSIYEYAKENSIKLQPSIPNYWKTYEKITWDENNYSHDKQCLQAWNNLHFNPVLSQKNCHYIGVCNRIEIFKIDYEIFDLSSQENFDKVWNHPVLQYMRRTVNSEDINPICKYCKNFDLAILRNTDSDMYGKVRDEAVKEFLQHCKNSLEFEDIEGLELLSENPSSDRKFQKKLEVLH